jgi:Predicted membrane protein
MRILPACLFILVFFGCNNRATKKDPSTDTIPAPSRIPDAVTATDTVFTAFGNEPFWAVYVIPNRKLVFHPMDGPDQEFPYAEPVSPDPLTLQYRSASDSSTLELTIIKKECSDGMSDMVHAYAVQLKINAISYAGCARKKP